MGPFAPGSSAGLKGPALHREGVSSPGVVSSSLRPCIETPGRPISEEVGMPSGPFATMLRVLVLLVLVVLAAVPHGQSSLYLFTIDQDALAGAPDFSALNKPLTAADALIVRDGHFYREIGGDPVRLFGVKSMPCSLTRLIPSLRRRRAMRPASERSGRLALRLSTTFHKYGDVL